MTARGGAVSLEVKALSGGFDGSFKGGSLAGIWKQPGGTLPLVLSPYQKPVLSKAALDTLSGTWTGPVSAGGATLTFVAQFKPDAKGDLQGSLAVPEQGGTPLPMSDIQFEGGKLTFRIPVVLGEYNATYANGAFTGLWRQGNPPQPAAGLPVVLKKGDYVAQVHVLKMPTEAFGKLAGAWNGNLQVSGPQGTVTLPVVMRFETNEHADMVAFMDSPAQHVKGIPITEASLDAGKVVIKVGALGEYDGTLAGNSMSGQWKQGPGSLPLTLTRK